MYSLGGVPYCGCPAVWAAKSSGIQPAVAPCGGKAGLCPPIDPNETVDGAICAATVNRVPALAETHADGTIMTVSRLWLSR
jgi:hypothetical protein